MKAKFYNCPGTKRIFFQLTILTVFVFTTPLFSQSFPISTDPSERYTIDKFNSDVYYLTYYTQKVYKKNLLTGNTELSAFPTLPAFANKSHLCVYGHDDSILVYDFESNSRIIIRDSVPNNAPVGWGFSPEDNYILFKDYYYSFKDSIAYPITFYPEVIYSALEWLNDSTIIINLYPDDYIYSFCFTTGLFDTIYNQPAGNLIASFSYDEVKSDLYYCLFDPGHPNYPKIRVKNLNTQSDSVVFDSFIHDPTGYCWESLCSIRSMKWFQQTSSLAFIGSEVTNPLAGIYVYRELEGKAYRYTDCDDEGGKTILNWYSKDTIIYVSSSYDWIRIEGYFLDKPVYVDNNNNLSEQAFNINAYPNPFNNSVNIIIKGISAERIYIYNIHGEKVKTLENENVTPSSETVFLWDGKNDRGIYLASGPYFIKVDNPAVNVTGKIIYIK